MSAAGSGNRYSRSTRSQPSFGRPPPALGHGCRGGDERSADLDLDVRPRTVSIERRLVVTETERPQDRGHNPGPRRD
jgi:hypothetical protein